MNYFFNEIIKWVPFLPILAILCSFLFRSEVPFLLCAILSIYFYGRFAFKIHNITQIKVKDGETYEVSVDENELPDPYRFNQYWFNGLGAMIGWTALFLLTFSVLKIDLDSFETALDTFARKATLKDLVFVAVAYLGTTGNLPAFISRFKA